MGLKSGSVGDIGSSMAEAMEQAFQAEWMAAKGKALPDAGKDDREILFAAIAQGVLGHLQQHINEALQIEVEVEQTSSSLISSSGSSVTVNQDSGSSNRVASEGNAVNIELQTDD